LLRDASNVIICTDCRENAMDWMHGIMSLWMRLLLRYAHVFD
jgi:hypothetical protein